MKLKLKWIYMSYEIVVFFFVRSVFLFVSIQLWDSFAMAIFHSWHTSRRWSLVNSLSIESNGQEKKVVPFWKSSYANFGWMTKTLTSSFEKLAHFSSFRRIISPSVCYFFFFVHARQTMSFNWDDLLFGLLFVFGWFFVYLFFFTFFFRQFGLVAKYWQTYVISNEHTYLRWLWKRHKNELILENTLSYLNRRFSILNMNARMNVDGNASCFVACDYSNSQLDCFEFEFSCVFV